MTIALNGKVRYNNFVEKERGVMNPIMLVAALWCPDPMILDLSKTPWTLRDQEVVETAHEYCRKDDGTEEVQLHNAQFGEWKCAMMIIKKDTTQYRGLYTIICPNYVGAEARQPIDIKREKE